MNEENFWLHTGDNLGNKMMINYPFNRGDPGDQILPYLARLIVRC